jgi:predicted peptidase
MRVSGIILLMLLTAARLAFGQRASDMKTNSTQTAQHLATERAERLTADYLLFLPKDYNAKLGKRWPLILFLHGAGERGTNVWLVAKHGPPKIVQQNPEFPFIVVSPQCLPDKIWSNETLISLLDDIVSEYAVDTNRVYLTGLSMGGYGAWELGLTYPERFAAIAPICGGGEFITPFLASGKKAEALKSLGVWAFHGAKDPVVPLRESERMVDLLKKIGVKEVKFTVYPDAEHDSWTQTYDNQELYDWFLKHSR